MGKVETEVRNGRGADCLRFIELVATALHRSYISDAAGTLHAQQRLCNGRLSRRSTAAAACGWFAAERAARAADIDRQLARSVANAGSVMS